MKKKQVKPKRKNNMKGIIYIKVALYLEQDVNEETEAEIVSEMDYEFKHNSISHTEIIEIV